MKTAAMLDMSYNTFRRRLEKYGLSGGEEYVAEQSDTVPPTKM
jgi:hypothetical protein